jgi:hypothetical protein
MSLPMTPPVVLAALFMAAPATSDVPAEPAPAQAVVQVPAPDGAPSGPCPAYLGPQCDSDAHDRWATGQELADLALHAA